MKNQPDDVMQNDEVNSSQSLSQNEAEDSKPPAPLVWTNSNDSQVWRCTVCTFDNCSTRSTCEMCGALNPSATPAAGGQPDPRALAAEGDPWTCSACTMVNRADSYTCHMCNTQNTAMKAKLGSKSDALNPKLLLKLAKERHFSLQDKLVELSHEMALVVAQSEEGHNFRHSMLMQNLEISGLFHGSRNLSHMGVNFEYAEPLLTIISEASKYAPEVTILACRTMNSYLQLDINCVNGVKAGPDEEEALDIYTICLTELTFEEQTASWDLAGELLAGICLICKPSLDAFRQLHLLGGLETVITCMKYFAERSCPEAFFLSALELLSSLADIAESRNGNLHDYIEELLQAIYSLLRLQGMPDAKTAAIALLRSKIIFKFGQYPTLEGLLTEQYQDILAILLADTGQQSTAPIDLVLQLLGLVRPAAISSALEQGVLLRTTLLSVVNTTSLFHSIALIKLVGLLAHLLTHKVLPIGSTGLASSRDPETSPGERPPNRRGGRATAPSFPVAQRTGWTGRRVKVKGRGDKTVGVVADMGYGTVMVDWKDSSGLEEVAVTEIEVLPASVPGSLWFRRPHGNRFRRAEDGRSGPSEDLQPGKVLLNRFLKQFISSGNVSMVQKVLKDGADPNCNLFKDKSPLMAAAESENSLDGALIHTLVEAGAEVDHCPPQGTALHLAARAGNMVAVRALLAHGASTHLTDSEGQTAIQCTEDKDIQALLETEISDPERKAMLPRNNIEFSDRARNEGLYDMLRVLLQRFPSAPSSLATIWLALMARVYSAVQTESFTLEDHKMISSITDKMITQKSADMGTLICTLKLLLDAVLRFPKHYISALHRCGVLSVLHDLEKKYSTDILVEDQEEMVHLGVTRWSELVLLVRSVLEQCSSDTQDLTSALSAHMERLLQLRAVVQDCQKADDHALTTLKDLGTLLISCDGITPHEFITAGLARALEGFLKQTDEKGWMCLEKAMACADEERKDEVVLFQNNNELPKPSALEKLIFLVHSTLDSRMFSAPFHGIHSVDLGTDPYPSPHLFGLPFGSHNGREGPRTTLSALFSPVTLEMGLPAAGATCRFKDSQKRIIIVKVQPLTRLGQLEETLLQSLVVTHPKYVKYCQSLVGGNVSFRQGLRWGPLWHVAGFDEDTGLHLLHNQHSREMQQVQLATKRYRALVDKKGHIRELLFPVPTFLMEEFDSDAEKKQTAASEEQDAKSNRPEGLFELKLGEIKTQDVGSTADAKETSQTPRTQHDLKTDNEIQELTQTAPNRRSAFLTPNIKQSVRSFLTSPRDKEKERERIRLRHASDNASYSSGFQEAKDNQLAPKPTNSARTPKEAEDQGSSRPSWLGKNKFMKQRSFGNLVNKLKERNPLSRRSPSPELNRGLSTSPNPLLFTLDERVEAQFKLPDGDWTTAWYAGTVKSTDKTGYSIVFDDGDQQSCIPESRVRALGPQPGVGSIIRVMWPREGGLPLRACITRVNHDGTSAVAYEDGDFEDLVPASRILPLNDGPNSSEESSGRHRLSEDSASKMRRAWVRVEGTGYWRPSVCTDAANEVGLHGIYNVVNTAGVLQVHEDDMLDIEETTYFNRRKISIAQRLFGRRHLAHPSLGRQHEEMKSHLETLRARLSRHRQRYSSLEGQEPMDQPELPILEPTLSALPVPRIEGEDGDDEGSENDHDLRQPDEETVAACITDDEAQPEEWITPPSLRLAIRRTKKSSLEMGFEPESNAPTSEACWSLFEEDDSLVKCMAGLQGRRVADDDVVSAHARQLASPQNITAFQFKIVMDGDGIETGLAPKRVWRQYFESLSGEQQMSFQLLHRMWAHGTRREQQETVPEAGFDFDLYHQKLPVWSNVKLCEALTVLLSEGVALASGALPPWADGLLCRFPFLVGPVGLRWRYFQASSLGVSRSLLILQQGNRQDQQTGNSSDTPVRETQQLFGQLKKEVIHISKDHLLKSAEKIMRVYAKKKVALEFRFIGEKGMGSGVTASFYSTLAEKLQSRETNYYWRLWLDKEGLKERQEGFLSHPNGLFPRPLPVEDFLRDDVICKFRFLGRLVGRTFLDSQLLPLPLSVDFLNLVLHKGLNDKDGTDMSPGDSKSNDEYWIDPTQLSRIYLKPGQIIYDLVKASDQVDSIRKSDSLSDEQKSELVSNVLVGDTSLSIERWLALSNLSMVDPITGFELIAGGELTEVTLDNLGFYIKRLKDTLLGIGIKEQVVEFQKGIDEVLPIHKLKLFFGKELSVLIGGEREFDWDLPYLETTVTPSHGYTPKSPPYRMMLEALAEMTAAQKKQFLLFVTGCPTPPPGGLARLSPTLEIIRRKNPSEMSASADYDLPFARTCTNTLHLPPYSSKAILVEKLHFVMENSTGIIDRD